MLFSDIRDFTGLSERLTPEELVALLNHRMTPIVPGQGSVGYITHGAHVGLALDNRQLLGREVLGDQPGHRFARPHCGAVGQKVHWVGSVFWHGSASI